jgi:hypothetical protein
LDGKLRSRLDVQVATVRNVGTSNASELATHVVEKASPC